MAPAGCSDVNGHTDGPIGQSDTFTAWWETLLVGRQAAHCRDSGARKTEIVAGRPLRGPDQSR